MKKNESYTKHDKNYSEKKKPKSRHELSGSINNNLNLLRKKDVPSKNTSSRCKDNKLIEKYQETKAFIKQSNVKLQKSASPNKFFQEDSVNSENNFRKVYSKQPSSRFHEVSNNNALIDDEKNYADKSNSNRLNFINNVNFIENSVEDTTNNKADDTIDVENHLNSSTEKIRQKQYEANMIPDNLEQQQSYFTMNKNFKPNVKNYNNETDFINKLNNQVFVKDGIKPSKNSTINKSKGLSEYKSNVRSSKNLSKVNFSKGKYNHSKLSLQNSEKNSMPGQVLVTPQNCGPSNQNKDASEPSLIHNQ